MPLTGNSTPASKQFNVNGPYLSRQNGGRTLLLHPLPRRPPCRSPQGEMTHD